MGLIYELANHQNRTTNLEIEEYTSTSLKEFRLSFKNSDCGCISGIYCEVSGTILEADIVFMRIAKTQRKQSIYH